MTDCIRRNVPRVRRFARVLRFACLATIVTLFTAPPVLAQGAPAHLQGPNLGTWIAAVVDVQLRASGGNGPGTYVWSLLAGALPPGVSLRTDVPSHYPSNANAGLLGIATTPGNYAFTLRVTSAGQSTDRAYTIKITGLNIKDPSLPDGFIGHAYWYKFTAFDNAGPVTFTANGALPAGLNLALDGTLSGMPTVSGSFNVPFRITDGVDTTFHSRSLNIFALNITTPGSLPNSTQGAFYSETLTATGGTGAFTFTACPGNTVGTNCQPGTSPFPPGLLLNANGTLSGTVAANAGVGKYSFTVTVTDGNNVSYSKLMSLVVIGLPPVPPNIGPYGSFLEDCTVRLSCVRGVSIGSGGAAPFTWSAVGLPPGMSIRTADNRQWWITPGDAEIWGTPTTVGDYDVQVTLTDANGETTSNTFRMHITPLWFRDRLGSGTINVPYSSKLNVWGGKLPYSVVHTGGVLPAGLAFDTGTFTLSGTPLENGQFNFSFNPVFRFTDADGNTLQDHSYFDISAGASTIEISTGKNLGARLLNASQTTTFTACCVPSLVWSHVAGNLPTGTTFLSNGVLSGTPTVAGTYTFMLQAVDATNPVNVAVREFTVTVTSLNITTARALPFANVGAAYNVALTASGGTGTLTWAFTPNTYPPPGLTIDSATGVLSGTITSPGRYFFSVDLGDQTGQVITLGFSISVYPAGVNPPLNLNIGPIFGPRGIGVFTTQLNTTGGTPAYSYSLTPGAPAIPGMRVQDGQPLPTGFNFPAGYLGVIEQPGTYQTSIRVTDSSGAHFDRAITVIVTSIHHLSQTTLPRAAVGVPYSFQLTGYGGSGNYSWSVSNLTQPAPGLTLTPSGLISGTPTAASVVSANVVLTDLSSGETLTVTYSLTVDPFPITTSGVLPRGVVGTPYSEALTAPGCGAPCNWSTTTTNLAGLSLAPDGTLSGTPTGTFNGSFTAIASGPNGSAQKILALQVLSNTPQPLFITSIITTSAVVGNVPATAILASGGTPPYTWAVQNGALPPGITLFASGDLAGNLNPGTAHLAGRAMQAGAFNFTLAVTDAVGASTTRAFTWNISALSVQYTNLPVTGPLLNNPLVYNTPYVQPLLVIGGTGNYGWALSAPLTSPMPPGLGLDGAGMVSGTPSSTGGFTLPIAATDDGGNSNVTNVTFNVSGGTPVTLGFTSGPNLGAFSQGFSRSFNVTPTGGTPPYTVTPLSPLPPGFALQSGDSLLGASASGTFFVSGVPLAAGVQTFTLHAQDSTGNIGVRTFTFNAVPFTLFSSVLGDGSVGVAYSQPLVTFNSVGGTWAIAAGSALPNGLAVSPAGVISGTPTTAGNFSFTLTATDVSGVPVNFGFSLRISQIAITDPLLLPQVAVLGQPFTYTFTATGPANPVWSATGLPAGLTLSATGTISGTPIGAGTFNVLVTVTDGVVPITRRFTLFVRLPNPAVLDSSLTSNLLADAVVGQSVGFTLNNTGGTPPYQWAVAPGSTLPPGLQLIVAGANLPNLLPGTTQLAGAPTTPGLYVFDLNLTDATGTVARRTFRLNVSAITIVSGSPRNAVSGALYSQQFLAVGGTPPYTFTMSPVSLTQDMLPPGLALAPNGLLSGTPTSTGNYTFLLRVTDSTGLTFARSTTLVVNSASGLRVTNTNPNDVWAGLGRLVFMLFASGPSSYTWTHVGGTLPSGVALVASGPTPQLAGAPTVPGTYSFTLRATDDNDGTIKADHTFTFRVAPIQLVAPAIAAGAVSAVPPGQVGVAYSFQFKAAGGTVPYTFAASPFAPLPAGLTLSAAGLLSGTPLAVGNYGVAVIVSDSAGNVLNVPATLNLSITPAGTPSPLVRVGAMTLADASVGVPYVGSLTETRRFVRGGTPPLAWAVTPGSTLPPGLVRFAGGNGISNILGGVPTTAGTYAFSMDVTDAAGQSLTVPFTLAVSNLALSPDSLPPGMVGAPYSQSLVASGGTPPYTLQFAPMSDVVPGLTLSPAGLLSGAPTAPGSFRLLLGLTDGAGNSFLGQYVVTVDNAAGQSPGLRVAPRPIQVYCEIGSPAPAPVPVSVTTTSGNLSFDALVTGIAGATLSAHAGTTPATLNLNLNPVGVAAGTYIGVVAVNANPFDAVPVTLTVAPPPPCSYTLNPAASSVPASGGAGSFAVSAGPACAWTTTGPPPSILQFTGGANGTGPGNVSYTVAANTSPNPRTLTVRVQGQPHSITQFGTACAFAISPSTLNVPAIGGGANITLTASDPSCAWAAAGLGAAPAGGTGSANVTVTIPPNLNALPQQVTATIAGRTLTVNQSGVGCTVSLSPNDAAAPAGGGQGTVGVTVPAGCGYDTTSAPSWVSITSGGTGTSSGNLVYAVAPNSTTSARIGTLTIGGQSFQITQAGLACSVTVDTSGLGSPFGPSGGAGLIGITTNGSNCTWAASSGAPWASLNALSGTGNGTIGVTLQSNAASTSPRFGALTIAGQVVNLQQDGTACTFSLKSAAGAAPASGGAGSASVVAPSVCGWNAVSNNLPWLTITSSGSGGTADVQFVAQPNPSAIPRVGTLTIAGLAYTLTQAGAPCAYALSHTNTQIAAAGASDLFTFSTAAGGCTPSAQSYAGWITVNTAFNGTNGTVTFDVTPNPSTGTRTGTIRLGEQNFTVQQTGGTCGFSLNAYSAAFGPSGNANASALGSPSAVGCVPVVGTDQPGFITLGNLTGPALNIFTLPYAITPFNSLTPSVRLGNITFGGQILKVKQTSY